MQILEAALAFAITMLVLSLVCSSFVELFHRFLKLRETGLKYLLEQMFDQVIKKYIEKDAKKAAAKDGKPLDKFVEELRHSFVERMRANRSPGGMTMQTNLSAPLMTDTKAQGASAGNFFGLFGGREMTSLTPAQFMERLGSIDLGKVDLPDALKKINDQANTLASDAAKTAGAVAAGAVDAVLKDVAQKFDAIGQEASTYFEGRARLVSVIAAIVLAFAINIDAVELFNTFLRDPNVRAKVIEQTQTATKQYLDAQKAAATPTPAAAPASANPSPPAPPQPSAQGAQPTPQQTAADAAKLKAATDEAEALKKKLEEEIAKTKKTVTQLTDLGVPIGWDKAKVKLYPLPLVCRKDGQPDEPAKTDGKCEDAKITAVVDCWAWIKLILALLLGGLLVGLGGPFWYDTVVGLSNIRNVASSIFGGKAPAQQPTVPSPQTQPNGKAEEKPQPKTPVDVFEAARSAREALKKAAAIS